MSHAQVQRFGGPRHQHAKQHVVADFGDLTCTCAASVKDILAHGSQDDARALQRSDFTSDDESEGAGGGPAGATGDRGIEHGESSLGSGARYFFGDVGGDGAAVDQQGL